MTNQLLTENELAQQLRCCARTVRRLRMQGVIPMIRVGRLVRYNPAEVAKALLSDSVDKTIAEAKLLQS